MEVLKNTTASNIFEELPRRRSPVPSTTALAKGQEAFPQPFERQALRDRRRSPRYKTLPVTAHELCRISELDVLAANALPRSSQGRRFDDVSVSTEAVRAARTIGVSAYLDDSLDRLVEANAESGWAAVGAREFTSSGSRLISVEEQADQEEAEDELSKLVPGNYIGF